MVVKEGQPALYWLTDGEFAYYTRTGRLADWARPGSVSGLAPMG